MGVTERPDAPVAAPLGAATSAVCDGILNRYVSFEQIVSVISRATT